MRRLIERTRGGRPAPYVREVIGSVWCLIVGCSFRGQFCTRCGRFLP